MSTGASTTDVSVAMADLIENGDGLMNNLGIQMPLVSSFEFAGPMSDQCNQAWQATQSPGNNWQWTAVPNNAAFPQNLVTAGILNNGSYNASNRTAFTYNGEPYWLYKMMNAATFNTTIYCF